MEPASKITFSNRRFMLVWAAISAILLAYYAFTGSEKLFYDPDDFMRLVQVRDLLAGQSWYDLHQYRVDPGASPISHWSRLVDIPILVFITILTPLFGQSVAEYLTIFAVPILTLGAILAMVRKFAVRKYDEEVALYACALILLLFPVLLQVLPSRIDHHGWQIFAAMAALYSVTGKNKIKDGALTGVAMAFGMAISIEILPLAAAFGGILGLRWLRNWDDRMWLVSYLGGLSISLLGFYLVSHPFSETQIYCDAISLPHIAFFAETAAGTALLSLRKPPHFTVQIGLFGLVGAAALAVFGSFAPQCLAAPFSNLDPIVYHYWYSNVAEGMPIWDNPVPLGIDGKIIRVTLCCFIAATIAYKSRGKGETWPAEYVLLLIATSIMGMFVPRSFSFSNIMLAPLSGYLVQQALRSIKQKISLPKKVFKFFICYIALFPAALVPFIPQPKAAEKAPEQKPSSEKPCNSAQTISRLNLLSPSIIFAEFDLGPQILFHTQHSVIATGHHRANLSIRDVLRTFMATPEQAREIIAAHKADYLLLCTDLGETGIYTGAAPHGLASQLIAGKVPAWLSSVDIGAPQNFRVYKIAPLKAEPKTQDGPKSS